MMREEQRRQEEAALLGKLKEELPGLKVLLESCSDHWGYEDPIYRLYHQSFKVYRLQDRTTEVVEALRSLAPHLALNKAFSQIVADGTGLKFVMKDQGNFGTEARRIVEAFLHARFMLEMAVKYGEILEEPPKPLPSGWAAFLYLFDLR